MEKLSQYTPENREKRESLAQQIFPCLRYQIHSSTHIVSLHFKGLTANTYIKP